MLTAKNLLIDLNSIACYFGVPTSKGASNEHGQNYFFSGYGIPASLRIPQMCYAISRRLQSDKFFMPGSIFMHGFCAIDLSREFTRYRIVFAIYAAKTLPHGVSGVDFPQHISQRQQSTRLAHLCRLRAGSDPSSPRTLPRRFIRDRFEGYGLRVGLNNHRPVSVAFSMGAFSKEQGRDQASHASGSARANPVIYRYHRREIRGCQYFGYPDPRSWIVLYHGSRISRLRAFVCYASGVCDIYHPGQIQHTMPASLFASSRQNNGTTSRPNNRINRPAIGQRLSRTTSPNQILRFRNPKIFYIPDQQLRYRRNDRGATLQIPLENRTIFPLDQTASAYQDFFRNITKRCQDTDLGRDFDLRARSHYQKTSQPQTKPLHNFTNFERDHFRQNTYIASTYEN